MELTGCQICLTKFYNVFNMKKHFYSQQHQQNMVEVFNNQDVFSVDGFFPFIIFMSSRLERKQPIVGLSMLTLCYSRESSSFFYLCHICEEKCTPERIFSHIVSGDHCSNYFSYTDPNKLSFSWIPSMDMRVLLRPQLMIEVQTKQSGTVEILDLPVKLLRKFETKSYSEVLCTLRENDKLNKLLEAVLPKRTMIQTYQKDSMRKHRLLGMQHIVECICDGLPERRYYLCTLCNLTFATHMIIKHVLSFDHIFCYFKAWHPSTLHSKESYTEHKKFVLEIDEFAKQTEKIYETTNTEMKQVKLKPGDFASVNFACYAEALKKLEPIAQKNMGSSLSINVEPGNKLEWRTTPVEFYCQNCNDTFKIKRLYMTHLSLPRHKRMVEKVFREVERADLCEQPGYKPHLGLYTYVQENLKTNQPVIGVSLVVACINTHVKMDTIYICFACEESFSESNLRQHFEHEKHLINTLMYQDPWRLPFAWENNLDVNTLRSLVWKEEEQNSTMTMKILDMPYSTFITLHPPSYQKVIKRLQLQHSILMRSVPCRQTYRKLQENERFPLLGQNFFVMYEAGQHPSVMSFLCLLCKRFLSDSESYAHVFSREHVEKFLEAFHPGSLNSATDAKTLLDLAKQAARIHSISNIQVIPLDKPIWEPCDYQRAILILASAKRRAKKGDLEPTITPKMKLIPRLTVKTMGKDNVGDDSKMMKGSENKASQKITDTSDATPTGMKVKAGAKITDEPCIKSEKFGENKETPAPVEVKLENTTEPISETKLKKVNSACSDVYQMIKEEKIEEPITIKTSEEITENTHKESLNQCKNNMCKDDVKKSLQGLSAKSEVYKCPDEDLKRKVSDKTKRLASKGDSSEDKDEVESRNTAVVKVSSNTNNQPEDHLWQYIKKKCRDPVVGLSALLECCCNHHDNIYLCDCCCEMIPEKNIITHVTGFYHYKMYLAGLQKLPPQTLQHQVEIRHKAALLERDSGCGEAQVIELDEDVYNRILNQEFKLARHTVSCLQGQGESRHELASTSALSAVQHVDTSVTLHAEHEGQYIYDNREVVTMEIDSDSEGPKTSSSITVTISVLTETTTSAAEVLPESTNDETTTCATEPKPDNADVCLSVSRSGNDMLSLQVSSGTNMTCFHLDSTNPKDGFAASTSVEPLKLTLPHTETSPDSTLTTHTKYMTAKTDSTSGSTKQASSVCGLTQSMSSSSAVSCSSITAKLKCSASTSNFSVSALTTKKTAANLNSSTTTTCETPLSTCTTSPTKCRETPNRSSATRSNSLTDTKMGESVDKSTGTSSSAFATTAKQNDANYNSNCTSGSPKCDATTSSITSAKSKCSTDTIKLRKIDFISTAATSSASAATTKRPTSKNTETSSGPAALHKTTLMCARSEHENPPTEDTPTTKIKPNEKLKYGRDQLITVTCGESQQVYCQLCSVRLTQSGHFMDFNHQLKYVKMKFPKLNTNQPDLKRKVARTVAHLVEIEKDVGPQHGNQLQVKRDVYKELAALSDKEALERLQQMIIQRQLPSLSADGGEETLRPPLTFTSPYEVSSPDDVQENKHEVQSWTDKSPEANDVNPGQHQSCVGLNKNPEATCIQEPDTPDQMENYGCADTTASESAGLLAHTTHICQETPTNGPQHETEQQQQQSSPSHKVEHVPAQSGYTLEPVHHSASQALPRISLGVRSQGCSNLSRFLSVKNLKSAIGLDLVWECQGTPDSLYICENCQKMLSHTEICMHMVSHDHQITCLKTQYPQFSYFMEEDLTEEEKLSILNGVALRLSKREGDAQIVILRPELFQRVRAAPFTEALEIVKNVKKGWRLSDFCQPVNVPQQTDNPGDQESQNKVLQLKMQPALELEMDHCDNEEIQKPENHDLEENAGDKALDGIKRRRVSSPLDVNVPLKINSMVSFLPDADTCLSSQDSHPSLSVHPETRTTVSQHPNSQSVSVRDKCHPCRKRPAPTSVETQIVSSYTSEPQCKDSLQAKCTPNSLQSTSQDSPESAFKSIFVKSSATSTLLSPKGTEPGSDEQKEFISDKFASLINLLKNIKSGKLVPDNAKMSTSPANDSSEVDVEQRVESKSVQTLSKMTENNQHLPIKTTMKEHSSSTKSLEAVVSDGGSVDLSCENQHVGPNPICVDCPNNSSPEIYSTTGNLFPKDIDARANCAMLPSTSTADHQTSVCSQSMIENVKQLKESPVCSAATNHNTHHILQPQGNTGTYSTEVCQMPIDCIITARPDRIKNQLMGEYAKQDHTMVNSSVEVPYRLSTVANPSVTYAGYSQHSQMAHVTTGPPHHLSSEAMANFKTQSPYVDTEGFHHSQGYTARGMQSSQQFANTVPPGLSLQMQQQQLMMIQQQHSSWTNPAQPGGGWRSDQ